MPYGRLGELERRVTRQPPLFLKKVGSRGSSPRRKSEYPSNRNADRFCTEGRTRPFFLFSRTKKSQKVQKGREMKAGCGQEMGEGESLFFHPKRAKKSLENTENKPLVRGRDERQEVARRNR